MNEKHLTHDYRNASGPVPIRMTNDYLFKALLQKNERVLKALICSVLHLDKDEIHEVEILNPIILGAHVDDKDVILDVRVLFDNAATVDLEKQVANQKNWKERSLYYACRNYTELKSGAGYVKAIPSIQIGFLDYTLFPEHPAFCSSYRLREDREYYTYTDKLAIYVVDLTEIELATEADRKYETDKWAALFRATNWEEVKMLAAGNTAIDEAAETVYHLSEDERIRQICEAREDYMRIQDDIKTIRERLEQEKVQLEAELEQKDAELEQKDAVIRQLQEQLAALQG